MYDMQHTGKGKQKGVNYVVTKTSKNTHSQTELHTSRCLFSVFFLCPCDCVHHKADYLLFI